MVAFGKVWLPFLHPLTTSVPMPFLALSPPLALCSVLTPREGLRSIQTNTETLERAEPLNQSKTVERRMTVWRGQGRPRKRTWPWVSEVTDHHLEQPQLFLEDDP